MAAAPVQSRLRLQDRRRKLRRIKLATAVCGLVAMIGAVSYAARLPQFTIHSVSVTGTNLVNRSDIEKAVTNRLSGSYSFVIPKNNALAAPLSLIQKDVSKSFPPVAKVSVSRKNLTAVDVVITERTQSALLCSNVSSSECLAMDSDGYVFSKAAEDPTLVRYYTDAPVPIGSTFLRGGFPTLSKEVQKVGEALRRTARTVKVGDDDTSVAVTFADGGELRFLRAANPDVLVQDVASVSASENFKTHAAFQYVDFRFGDKVYVKY